jgi:prepilin peptidase CpaA
MTGGNPQLILLGALALLLLIAAGTDLRARIIPNLLNAAIALLAPAYWWASGMALWPDAAVQLGLGALVFALFALAFWRGWMGGGDVKLLGALALWLPLAAIVRMLFVMSLVGGLITLVVMLLHKWRPRPAAPEVPYGVAIAAAGLWAIAERYLNHLA